MDAGDGESAKVMILYPAPLRVGLTMRPARMLAPTAAGCCFGSVAASADDMDCDGTRPEVALKDPPKGVGTEFRGMASAAMPRCCISGIG
jgi:hypothetical protein